LDPGLLKIWMLPMWPFSVHCSTVFWHSYNGAVFFAVHYLIQKVLYIWAPKQPGPIYYVLDGQPQPVSNGFISDPLSPVKPVTPVMAHSSIVERLQLFTVDMLRRFNCKLDPEKGTWVKMTPLPRNNLCLCTSWSHIVEWRYSSTHS
jgi:hypothetical protein